LEESEEVCWKGGVATGEEKRREEKRRKRQSAHRGVGSFYNATV